MLDQNVMAAVLPTLPQSSVCFVITSLHCSRHLSFNIKSKETTGKVHRCHCISWLILRHKSVEQQVLRKTKTLILISKWSFASCFVCVSVTLTLILLTWTIWRAPTNASKWRMGFNSAFKGLREERRLKVFEKRLLWRVFWPKKDEVTG